MTELEALGTVVETDLLIIGGGFGGLWAAIQAKAEGAATVTLVDRGFTGMVGHSKFVSGGTVALLPADDLKAWVDDIVRVNEGIADRSMISAILQDSYQRIRDLESFGVEFPKQNGTYERIPARGAQRVKQLTAPKGGGGAMMLALRNQALHRGVRLVNRVFVWGLLKDRQGRAAGAVGYDLWTGGFYVFKAKATVLATNSGGFRGHHLAADQQGTGVFMAYEIGAELKNAEFHYINIRPVKYEMEGSGILPVFGARWVNSENDYFVARYDTVLEDRASHHLILTALAQEARAGRAPISMDTPAMSPENRERFRAMMTKGWLVALYAKAVREDQDYLSERVEWQPAYESNRVGLFTDNTGAARGVSGLFAAGMAKSFDPNPMTGWSIASCIWSGYAAGTAAARYIREVPAPSLDAPEVARLKEQIHRPLKNDRGLRPDRLVLLLQRTLFPYDVLILQHAERLQRALAVVKSLRLEQLGRLVARDYHELAKVRETETMVLGAEMSLSAALMREETRPNIFFREDFPERNDEAWLKWIVIRTSDQGMTLTPVPIPTV